VSNPELRELLSRIGAAARPSGSSAEARAREVCADWLRDAGFVVTERPFTYSAAPGLWGTPLAGLVLLVTASATAFEIARGEATADRALRIAAVAVALTGCAGWWVGRYGTRLLPFWRRRGVNLEARRGVPHVWLVAHLDSKSQPFSLLTRASAAVGVASGWTGVLVAWAVSHFVPVPTWVFLTLLGCAAVSAVPLLASWIGTRGDGALDNASGVAAVLGAAREIDTSLPLGVVVTSAEEFGLAGARAWVNRVPGGSVRTGVAINCDGVDDHGALTITAGGAGRRMVDLFAGVVAARRPDVQIRRSLPGVLLDATAFADAGWAACTVSQGTRGSLARVHTSRDTLASFSSDGVESVAGVIASLGGSIIAGSTTPEYQRGGSERTWSNSD
jgi:hypothetical protein